MPVPGKLTSVQDRFIFARIMLQNAPQSILEDFANTYNESTWGRIRFGEGPVVRVYEKIHFYNFGFGYFKCYFKVINDALINGEVISYYRHPIATEFTSQLPKILNDTLYASNASQRYLTTITPKDRKEREEMVQKIEKINEKRMVDMSLKYSFIVKYIDEAELNNKISTATSPFYYYNYFSFNFVDCASIFEGQSGQIIYQRGDMQANRNNDFYLHNIEVHLKEMGKKSR